MASGLLPKSPVSSSLCDEVPHISIQKSHLEPREFLISSAKRLLQHNRHIAAFAASQRQGRYWTNNGQRSAQTLNRYAAQEALSLPHRNAALQQESADLIDDAGVLADKPLPHPVQRLQVELIGGLRRHELHRRALHRLGDRLSIAEVILLSLRVGPYVLRRHH